jgi:hypothetical protein
MVALSLLGMVGATFGWDYYPTSFSWGFQNNCFFGFNQAVNFTSAPQLGVPHDDSLVGYWAFDEGSGTVANDGSGNGNNGTLGGSPLPSWVAGKYGDALSFNGINDYVQVPSSSSLNPTQITIAAWLNISSTGNDQSIVNKIIWATSGYRLVVLSSGVLDFNVGFGGADSVSTVPYNSWTFVVVTFDGSYVTFYVNGVSQTGDRTALRGSIISNTTPLDIGESGGEYWVLGVIDEVRIYNRALSAAEVAASYIMGPQPDIASFANYYSYTDPVTNNTMLIHVNNPNASSNNVALVTCTNFFAAKRLSFQANNTATINVWTNLGPPAFTTGVWNSQNYTTTLTLNDASTVELNWNTYNITTYADAHASASPSNVTVAYGGSQTLNFSATQGYNFKVAVDGTPKGQISSYTFNNVTAPHTVNITSTLIQPFPLELLIVGAIVIIVAVFALAFKKGYITIEVVDEENPQETQDDYTI